MGWSSPGLAVQRHAENLRSNRARVVGDRNSRGWNRSYRGFGKNPRLDTEPTKGQVRRTETSDRRTCHSRRKRYWMGAGEELKVGGQDVLRPPGVEDRRKAAAAVSTFEVESRKVADHR